jgi:hypothetical protein
MKKAFLFGMMLLFVTALSAQTNNSTTPQPTKEDKSSTKVPEMTFEKTVHDYGQIYVSDNGDCVFNFKNTGKADLILTNCSSSCGCTVPEWPKEPIPPGGKAKITVHYNTGRVGAINKQVYVDSNTGNRVVLTITGNVNAKPTEAVPENNQNIMQPK